MTEVSADFKEAAAQLLQDLDLECQCWRHRTAMEPEILEKYGGITVKLINLMRIVYFAWLEVTHFGSLSSYWAWLRSNFGSPQSLWVYFGITLGLHSREETNYYGFKIYC